MKLGIAGKGGTGKTTIVGTLAREYGRSGRRVTAIDVDPHPTLATTLGIPTGPDGVPAASPDLFEVVAADGGSLRLPAAEIVARFGVPAPDDVTLLVAHRLEHVEMHCNSVTHAMVRSLLASLIAERDDVVLVDMEAGVEHFSRAGGTLAPADALLIVVEPFHKSMVTGAQVAALSAELGIPHRFVVANKVRNAADLVPVGEFCRDTGLEMIATIPWDVVLHEAEVQGRAPIDFAPTSPAVLAARDLATIVLERVEGKPAPLG